MTFRRFFASFLFLAAACSEAAPVAQTPADGNPTDGPVDAGGDVSCPYLAYVQPGCDGTVEPVCHGGVGDACVGVFCSCSGQTIVGGCGWSDVPFQHHGECEGMPADAGFADH